MPRPPPLARGAHWAFPRAHSAQDVQSCSHFTIWFIYPLLPFIPQTQSTPYMPLVQAWGEVLRKP